MFLDEENIGISDVVITDLNDCVLGNMEDHKNLKVEAIIDFNK